ncbi:hypothetical protein [Priestia megaterium]|uniref:hypothetical protein n=1 Tax=Priestia megaterium TaxID=1404 RepID=UPI0027315DBD|nr:hypothetical protein [Priestia megaterium]MDP1443070.1 hypothetical protein [Priestia megaterium]MDP1472264.1 hypothetical protein [Priestia megaterium]
MSNYIIIALIVTSIIFIVATAIGKANRKIESEAINKKPAMVKTFIDQKELLLEKSNQLLKQCRVLMLLALVGSIVFKYVSPFPFLAPLFFIATYAFLVMYILTGMMRSSLTKRIEELKGYSNKRKKIN